MFCADAPPCCKCPNTPSICDFSGWYLVEYILFCHLLWWIGYYFLLLVTKRSEEWCCRILTFIHGCLISYSALRDAYVNKSPIDFKRVPLSTAKKNYLSYMLSYFLFDFCWIHFFGNEQWIIYVHHIASILIITNLLVRNYGGAGVAYGAAGLELTNPYLQLRWFLRSLGYYHSPFFKFLDFWFITLFFIIRILGGTVLTYCAVFRSNTDLTTKLSFSSIYGISLVLQWQIFMYFKRKYLSSHHNHMQLIHSRVSMSPYFQRRTLDRNQEEEDVEAAPKTASIGSPAVEFVLSESPNVDPAVFDSKEKSQVNLAGLESSDTEPNPFSGDTDNFEEGNNDETKKDEDDD